ncbi:DUF2970 domain-containing protein [Cupriavidus oxalaticus]|uniref:DUF2970 domain-containing protein n=1 Tax=Cupriavidus oxalaticus TaxID=96344 RepID=A0A5P3VJQ6_9BURK|nr:DUF2970 domain-containing protein [Cupriavidus oxalaticus]QEZ46470.1 DUF2970 domain-containing protein [Cupriavidus oxalaticus]
MNPLRLLRTVLWGFVGLRKGQEHQRDLENLRPVPLILTGVAVAAGLVACLVLAANWAVSNASAAAGAVPAMTIA